MRSATERKKKQNISLLFLILRELLTIHWHLVNLCGVILLNISQDPDVIVLHEVDGHTLATETTGASDSVDVELTVVWQIVVDDQRHLGDHTKDSN